MPRSDVRILALDVDGTLLDGSGTLRPRTIEAVRKAAEAGLQPVLCTGRRYRRARPIALELGLNTPIVCNSGALVKEPFTHATLWRADLPTQVVVELLELFRELDEPAVSFTDRAPDQADFRVTQDPMGRYHFDDYLSQNREHAEIDPLWPQRVGVEPHYHICTIGDQPRMAEVEREVLRRFSDSVRTFVQRSPRYIGTMCEVLNKEASKWSALLHLAEQWGVAPEEICAVGDDKNDVPMIEGAGFGVAMGHAPEEVIAIADHVTLCDDEDGLAHLIEHVLLG